MEDEERKWTNENIDEVMILTSAPMEGVASVTSLAFKEIVIPTDRLIKGLGIIFFNNCSLYLSSTNIVVLLPSNQTK